MTPAATGTAGVDSDAAFLDRIDPYRRELHLHCYRMMGSLVDAEDLLQETILAAWRGRQGFDRRSSLRTWLYRIATNRCLNALRDARRRPRVQPVPPFDAPPASSQTEVSWLQPYPDAWLDGVTGEGPDAAAQPLARENIELAFVAALQRLPPRQIAALVLCDVLGFSRAELASMLAIPSNAAKGVLQRARASVAQRRRMTSHHRPPSTRDAEVASKFAQAFTADDVDGVIRLLTDDAWLAMPPAPHEYHGRAAIRAFLWSSRTWRDGRRFRLIPTGANAQPAFGCYLPNREAAEARFNGVIVLSLRGGSIVGLTRFLDPELRHPFELPPGVTLDPTPVG